MARTFYFKNAAASGSSHGSLQDGGTGPSNATMTTGWKVAKTAATVYDLVVFNAAATATFRASRPRRRGVAR